MAFHEVRFPDNISYGSSGGPGFSTVIVTTDSGAEQRVGRWSVPRRRYNVAYGVKSHGDLAALAAFYIARQGPLFGFRYKDWLDCTTADTHRAPPLGGKPPAFDDSLLGVGDGKTKTFQLKKVYSSGGINRVRNITKPVVGTVFVGVNGIQLATGWTVDTATGIITLTDAPGTGVPVTAGCYFDVPVRFGEEVDDVLSLSIDNFGSGSSKDIPLIEIMDTTPAYEEFFFGGGVELAIDSNLQLELSRARVWVLEPVEADLVVNLPDETSIPSGGPIMFVINKGQEDLAVHTFEDEEFLTLSPDQGITLVLTESPLGKVWYAL